MMAVQRDGDAELSRVGRRAKGYVAALFHIKFL